MVVIAEQIFMMKRPMFFVPAPAERARASKIRLASRHSMLLVLAAVVVLTTTNPAAADNYRVWMDGFSQIPPYYRIATRNYENDEVPNVLKFTFGGSPVIPQTSPLYGIQASNGSPLLQFSQATNVAPCAFYPQMKNTLTNGSWLVLSNTVYQTNGYSGSKRLMQATVPNGNTGFFDFMVVVPTNINQAVSATNFGVTMNGSTDDTVAFQGALNSGGILQVPPGVAILSQPLVVAPGTWLIGSGSAVSELRWVKGNNPGGLTGTSMAISGLYLHAANMAPATAVTCQGGPLHASDIWIGSSLNGSWTNGVLMNSTTNVWLSGIKFVGVTNTVSAINFAGSCSNGLLEDFHSAQTYYGILINGNSSDLTFRRITAIASQYALYINPPSIASNILVYDLNFAASYGSLWLTNVVNSQFISGYPGLSNDNNPAYEGAITVNGSASTGLTFSGLRIQDNYQVTSNLVPGFLLNAGSNINISGCDIRQVEQGLVVNNKCKAVIIDGLNIYSDVATPMITNGAGVTVIPYQKIH